MIIDGIRSNARPVTKFEMAYAIDRSFVNDGAGGSSKGVSETVQTSCSVCDHSNGLDEHARPGRLV